MNRVSACRDITSVQSGKKYGIVPARIYQITIIYCALLRQSRDTVPVAEHPYISYGLVTRTFPEHSCIPIYMHLCHIFFVSIYFRNLPNTLELQSGEWLVSREWRCNMYYLGLTHLITRSAPFRNPTIAY